jgi:hypothetical protein
MPLIEESLQRANILKRKSGGNIVYHPLLTRIVDKINAGHYQ